MSKKIKGHRECAVEECTKRPVMITGIDNRYYCMEHGEAMLMRFYEIDEPPKEE